MFSGAAPEEDVESGMEPLLEERKHVTGALQGVAAVLAQGLEARAALARQRDSLGASNLSVSGIVHNNYRYATKKDPPQRHHRDHHRMLRLLPPLGYHPLKSLSLFVLD